MKKAINLTTLVIYVFIAIFLCNKTVESANNGLFLSNNNSEAAKKYIDATKTELPKDSLTKNIKENITGEKSLPLSFSINNSSQKEIFPANNLTASSSIIKSKDNNLIATLTSNNNEAKNYNEEGSLPLFSSNRTATQTIPLFSVNNNFSGTFSLIISLVGIIVLALAASWFIQKKTRFGSDNFGKVLGIVPLDNKRLIYIVDIMGKMLILGVTENNISLLTEITDKETADTYRIKFGQSTLSPLDKFFPFSINDNDEKKDKNINEKEKEIIVNRKSAKIKESIDKNREKLLNRLNNMKIK